MKFKITLLLTFLALQFAHAQKVCNELYQKKFTKEQLFEDIDFIKDKIINVHVNPFTEISKVAFESKVISIKNQLQEGMTQRDFHTLVKPLLVTLNDEHSWLDDYCVNDSIKTNYKVLPLKFKYEDGKMLLTENFSEQELLLNDELITLNNIPIQDILKNCAQMITGTKEDRISLLVDKFWSIVQRQCYGNTDKYHLKFKSGKSVIVPVRPIHTVMNLLAISEKEKKASKKNSLPLTYQKIRNMAIVKVATFDERRSFPLEQWKIKLDSIFTKIENDRIQKLIIDISENKGGNSAIGNLIIDYFSDRNYQSYQGNFKFSQSYYDFVKSINPAMSGKYDQFKEGEIIPIKSRNVQPTKNPLRFRGSTYIVVGKNTFSSAMMFAVTILDNELATVIGEIPRKGHPNHFGEIYKSETPNTKLGFGFGVKEWIRPKNLSPTNLLIPNKIISLEDLDEEAWVNTLIALP